MTFADAIRDGFAQYANFNGRSSRPAYWWWWLFGVLVLIVAAVLDAALGTWVFYAAVALGFLIPNLAVGVRRLHDTGRSGWWLLIGLIPLVGAIVLLVFFVQPSDGPNQWGGGPDNAGAPQFAPPPTA